MFMLDKSVILDRSNIKKDFRRYNPPSLATINNANQLITIDIPREDAFINLNDAYLSIELKVVKSADDTRYADNTPLTLVNMGGIALFSEASLSTSSKKQLERIDHVYQASLMYKMLSASDEDESLYFVKDDGVALVVRAEDADATAHVAGNIGDKTIAFNKRRNRLINDNPEKGTLFLNIPLSEIFGFALHQDKIIYGLGFMLTLKRASNDNAIYRLGGVDAAKIEITDIALYVPHYTTSLENQILVTEHVNNNNLTNMSYIERVMSTKSVNGNNTWTFELGVEAGMDIPIYVIVGFQTATRMGPSQEQNNGIFDRLDVIGASLKIGSERYPDNEMQIDYNRNNYVQPYDELKRFKKEYIGEQSLGPFVTYKEFKDLYNLYVFDIRNQKEHLSAQQIQIKFQFRTGYDAVAQNATAFALVLKNRVIEISSQSNKQFDIIS